MSCSEVFLERMTDKKHIPEHTIYTDEHTHYHIA